MTANQFTRLRTSMIESGRTVSTTGPSPDVPVEVPSRTVCTSAGGAGRWLPAPPGQRDCFELRTTPPPAARGRLSFVFPRPRRASA